MQKRAMTLLEIMIVVLLITMITGVVGYNFKGSLEKGKVFKSRQGISRLHDIFDLYLAENNVTVKEIAKEPEKYLKKTEMAKDATTLLVDGWGVSYDFKEDTDGSLKISSKALTAHDDKAKSKK